MDAYVKYFRYCGWSCLRYPGRRQRGGDAGGFPVLALRSYEKPLDRCSPGGWIFVCDSALHHGLRHESEACECGNNRSPAYALNCAYCACACPRASAFPEDIDRPPLQAEPFVAETIRNNYFRDFVCACGHPHALRTSSFGESWKLGAKARDWCGCCSVSCPVRPEVQEEEAATRFRRVGAYSGDSCTGNSIRQSRKLEAPNASSAVTDRAANARHQNAALPGSRRKTAWC